MFTDLNRKSLKVDLEVNSTRTKVAINSSVQNNASDFEDGILKEVAEYNY